MDGNRVVFKRRLKAALEQRRIGSPLSSTPCRAARAAATSMTAAAIAAVVAGLLDAVGVGLFLLPVPYILTAVVGVWRSAQRYEGPPKWAFLAKVAVIVWGAIMILI